MTEFKYGDPVFATLYNGRVLRGYYVSNTTNDRHIVSSSRNADESLTFHVTNVKIDRVRRTVHAIKKFLIS